MTTKDWGNDQIIVISPIVEMRPVELHHRANGATDEQPSFAFVFQAPNRTPVLGQITLRELSEALGELGYTISVETKRSAPARKKPANIHLQYFNGRHWVLVSQWQSETLAWASLGTDDLNYRTVDSSTGRVLTDKSVRSDDYGKEP